MSLTEHQKRLSKLRVIHIDLRDPLNTSVEAQKWRESISDIDQKKIVAILAFIVGVESLLELVKAVRNTLGCGLKEAKDLVDDYVNYHSI